MPIYKMRCDGCGFRGEVFFKMKDRRLCNCGRELVQEFTTFSVGTTQFVKDDGFAMDHSCSPSDYQDYCKALGSSELADCVCPQTGKVRFPDTKTARKFNRRVRQVMDQVRGRGDDPNAPGARSSGPEGNKKPESLPTRGS